MKSDGRNVDYNMLDITDTLLKQILDYVETIQNFSYYELKYYAENNRPDWAAVLKHKPSRTCIAEYLRGRRRECRRNGIPQPTLYESMRKIYGKEPI